MSIFPKRPTACDACRLYFEPDPDPMFARWQHLCPLHREPIMARDLLKDEVMKWAEENWQELIPRLATTDSRIQQLAEKAKDVIHMPSGQKQIE